MQGLLHHGPDGLPHWGNGEASASAIAGVRAGADAMSKELSIVALGHNEETVALQQQVEVLREDLLALAVDRGGPLQPAPRSRSGVAEVVGARLVALQATVLPLEGAIGVVGKVVGSVSKCARHGVLREALVPVVGESVRQAGPAPHRPRSARPSWLLVRG